MPQAYFDRKNTSVFQLVYITFTSKKVTRWTKLFVTILGGGGKESFYKNILNIQNQLVGYAK
jgi:hypothetical protein